MRIKINYSNKRLGWQPYEQTFAYQGKIKIHYIEDTEASKTSSSKKSEKDEKKSSTIMIM